MKKLILTFLILLSIKSFSQKNYEEIPTLVSVLNNYTKLEITFVSYDFIKKDSIVFTQISYYDYNKKDFVNLIKEEINNKFPNLLKWFTSTSDTPPCSTVWTNINNRNLIYTHFLGEGSNVFNNSR